MRRPMISCALGLAIGAYSLTSAAQCTVDTDCKGDRICQGGQCVTPSPAPAPVTYSTSTAAPAPIGGFKPFVVGAFMSMGLAHAFIEIDGDSDDDAKPRFAGGGGAYLDFYVSEIFALEAGLGFIGKGTRYHEDDVTEWLRIIYMEIPLGVKLNLQGFQIGVAIAMNVALSGKIKYKSDDEEVSSDFGDDEWDNYRRFNLCPRITLGYAIPVGPIAIVPGIAWSIEVINTAKGDLADDADGKIHNMNFMFNVGVEYGFGG